MTRFSVVINNYNYARYLRECIDSALAQTWVEKEVVVVDDGSTDGSRAIIESYGSRIVPVFKKNGGQGSAINAGFKASTGKWVIFLDADDKLFPGAVAKVMQRAGVASTNVQYHLSIIDEKSREINVLLPTRPMHEGDVRPIVAMFRYYNSPPSSGNAYARRYLEQVLPMPEEDWRISADAYLILAAPFHGFIESIREPLAWYRRHGGGASDSAPATLEQLRTYVAKELTKEIKRETYVKGVVHAHSYGAHLHTYQSPTHCKYELLDVRCRADHLRTGEYIAVVRNFLTCAWQWPNYNAYNRVVFTLWCCAVVMLPQRWLPKLAAYTLHPHWRAQYLGRSWWG